MTARLTPAGTARVRACMDARCPMYGVPKMQQVRHTVAFDDFGNAVDV